MQTIVGIGTDIEEIKRFDSTKNPKLPQLIQTIFSPKELSYCLSSPGLAAQRLAARFAAKEAVLKSLSGFLDPPPKLGNIEILKQTNGSPTVKLKNGNPKLQIFVSLSHSDGFAIAFVVATIGS